MSGRYTLTVQYDEPNPAYVPRQNDHFGNSTVFEPERRSVQVLSVQVTPEQWEQLKRDTLNAWSPMQDGGK